MRNRFVEKMDRLHKEMLEMGTLCEKAIMKTYKLLLSEAEEREELVQEIDRLEHEIDQQERQVESICIQLLLQQQPVASDLRKISAALKMITDLERIGDQATDIAEIIQLGTIQLPMNSPKLTQMAEATMKMVNNSIESYVESSLAMAQEVIDSDDVVDDAFLAVRGEIMDELRSGEVSGDQAMDLLMVAKYYERIGDHASNIGEWVEFSITGKHRSGKEINDVFRV